MTARILAIGVAAALAGCTTYNYTPPPPPPSVAGAPQAQTCREYQISATIDGRPQQVVGTACLQPDGSWRDGSAQ